MDLTRATDVELLTTYRFDAEAFAEFYRRFEEPILLYMLRRTQSADLAADLTSEVFASALQSAARYKPTGAPVAAWLFAIAANVLKTSRRKAKVVDEARRRLAAQPLVLTDDLLAHIERLGDVGLGQAALSRLAALPEDQRRAIEQAVIAERPYGEIASEFECSSSVIRQRVSRGLASLRAQMEPLQ